ncbi:galectin-3-like isoform X2 [Mercenaria mercenaria]|uniref:galectin-3-like isoform X2 n=1 Tax=Mercenaria mercenaria TaxID=6596 RepID=UPI00234EF2B2|nr:galectin-3-like isoform X2 [Mercenaria mercenaria]
MSYRNRRRMDGDMNQRADIDRVARAAGHFAGAMIDEFRDRNRPSWYPTVPFVRKTGLLRPNNIIFICGVPHQKANRFTVYLQKGNRHEPPLVAMCVDARFDFGGDRNIVLRNHKDGDWGREEKQLSYFPFRPNESFEMIILVERNRFMVAVNNKHMLEFNHRIRALGDIDALRIDGDVTLTQFRIQD